MKGICVRLKTITRTNPTLWFSDHRHLSHSITDKIYVSSFVVHGTLGGLLELCATAHVSWLVEKTWLQSIEGFRKIPGSSNFGAVHCAGQHLYLRRQLLPSCVEQVRDTPREDLSDTSNDHSLIRFRDVYPRSIDCCLIQCREGGAGVQAPTGEESVGEDFHANS